MKINKVIFTLLCATVLSPKILACTLAVGANPNMLEERQSDVWIILGISLFFVISTLLLNFKTSKKGLIVSLMSILTFGYAILRSNVYIGDCGGGAISSAETNVIITFVCFMFQLVTFIFFRKKSLAELP